MSALPFGLAFAVFFTVIFATGLRYERRGEKPFREHPDIWSRDASETERRYNAALAKWRQRA